MILSFCHYDNLVPDILKKTSGVLTTYLQVFHGIPVVFHKNNRVCTRQIQSQSTNMRCQQ